MRDLFLIRFIIKTNIIQYLCFKNKLIHLIIKIIIFLIYYFYKFLDYV